MSMHKIPLTAHEEEGLRKHGLDIGTPSQLSDVFRQGMKWQAARQQAPAETKDSYPPCDYCGCIPDHHPWHGSGTFKGVDSPHIHACNECRKKLPGQQAPAEQEPVAWLVDWPDEPELGHYFSEEPNENARSKPLYTAPAPPVNDTAALERVAELEALLRDARELIDHGDFREGHCMCGSDVNRHTIGDGHSPVDSGVYYAGQVMERIDAAIANHGEAGI